MAAARAASKPAKKAPGNIVGETPIRAPTPPGRTSPSPSQGAKAKETTEHKRIARQMFAAWKARRGRKGHGQAGGGRPGRSRPSCWPRHRSTRANRSTDSAAKDASQPKNPPPGKMNYISHAEEGRGEALEEHGVRVEVDHFGFWSQHSPEVDNDGKWECKLKIRNPKTGQRPPEDHQGLQARGCCHDRQRVQESGHSRCEDPQIRRSNRPSQEFYSE